MTDPGEVDMMSREQRFYQRLALGKGFDKGKGKGKSKGKEGKDGKVKKGKNADGG